MDPLEIRKNQVEQINAKISKLSTEHWKLSTDAGGHLIANVDGAAFKAAFRYDPFDARGYADISSFISRSVLAILRRCCAVMDTSIRTLTKTIAKEAVEIERLANTDEFKQEVAKILQSSTEGADSLE